MRPPKRGSMSGSWLPLSQTHSRSSCMMCRICQILLGHALGGADIMQAVAQRDHALGLVAVDHLGEPRQRAARVS